MKILEGLVVASFLVASNVVAAGVVLVLGQMLQALAPAWQSPWPWILICAAAAAAAFLFLKGAMFYAAERARGAHPKPFAGLPDPHKGLESASGQRGG